MNRRKRTHEDDQSVQSEEESHFSKGQKNNKCFQEEMSKCVKNFRKLLLESQQTQL